MGKLTGVLPSCRGGKIVGLRQERVALEVEAVEIDVVERKICLEDSLLAFRMEEELADWSLARWKGTPCSRICFE